MPVSIICTRRGVYSEVLLVLALYAIGDLHLSLGGDKPMDVFGGRWQGYVEKLKRALRI